jgi:hypothetical protein
LRCRNDYPSRSQEHAFARLPSSAAQPVDSGLFLSSQAGPAFWPVLRRHPSSRSRLLGSSRVMHSTPQRSTRHVTRTLLAGRFPASDPGRFGPLAPPDMVQNQGRQALAPQPEKAWRSGHFGTLLGATGGTQTHSRRTVSKLGQVRHARQGLVRVSESNTKYGGQRGDNRAGAAPVIEPSISESSGIPKPKNLRSAVDRVFAPLFTGQGNFSAIFPGYGLILRDSRRPTGNPGGRHVGAVMAGRQNRGQAATDSHLRRVP